MKLTFNCLHSSNIEVSKDCIDCDFSNALTLCYECIDCNNCSHCRYLQNSSGCTDCYIGSGLKNCSDCFGCVNLGNKQFCYFNEQLTHEEYDEKVRKGSFCKGLIKFHEFSQKFPMTFNGIMNDCSEFPETEEVEIPSQDKSDNIRTCLDCNADFPISKTERAAYIRRIIMPPSKCHKCRYKDRVARGLSFKCS